MIKKITYEDKEAVDTNDDYPQKNQVMATDMNEIKSTVNENADELTESQKIIQSLQEENANLKAQIPTGTAAGEEIGLSDSAEMELVDFGLEGSSKQAIREGYNLLPPFSSTVLNGITYTKNEDGTITVNGTASADSFYRQNINLEEGDYYLSGSPTGGANNTYYLQAMGYGEAGNDYGSGTTFKVTSSSSVGIRIMICNGTTVNNLVFKPMLVKGTEKKDYEQYGASPSLEYPSEVQAVGDSGNVEIVKSNKNILDFGNQTGNGITFNKNRITLNNPTGFLYSTNNNIGGNKFLSGKTLIFSLKANGEITGNNMAQFIVHSNKRQYLVSVNYPKKSYANTINTVKVTLADDERISSVQVWTAGTTCDLTIDVQVEIADEASEVIEHEGNTYPIPVQREMLANDYIDYTNKKEVHTWKKVIKTSADDFNVTKDTTNQTFQFNCTVENGNLSSSVLCNMFKFWDKTWKNTGCFISYNSNFYALIKFGEYGFNEDLTIEQAKQKFADILAETSLVFYYTLTVAEELDLTEEQKQVLEQIVKDGTCKEVTHFYTTEDLKSIIEVKYYKDLETLFKNQASMQETLNNVQAQILELGGN